MSKREFAFISFYDEVTQQVKFCVVPRAHVQASIDRAVILNAAPDAPEHSSDPITDEDARKLGGIAYMCHAREHLELRERLQITTEEPTNWSPTPPPSID
nr:hypothetical protein [Burkholderia sp. L27(2015)]